MSITTLSRGFTSALSYWTSRMSIVLSSDTSNLYRNVQLNYGLPHKKIKLLNCRTLKYSSTQEYKISVSICLCVLRTFFELSSEIFDLIFAREVYEIIDVYLWYTRWEIWKSYSRRSCIFSFFPTSSNYPWDPCIWKVSFIPFVPSLRVWYTSFESSSCRNFGSCHCRETSGPFWFHQSFRILIEILSKNKLSFK